MGRKQSKGKHSLRGRGQAVLTKVPICRVASETRGRNQNFRAAALVGALLGLSWRREQLCMMSVRASKSKL